MARSGYVVMSSHAVCPAAGLRLLTGTQDVIVTEKWGQAWWDEGESANACEQGCRRASPKRKRKSVLLLPHCGRGIGEVFFAVQGSRTRPCAYRSLRVSLKNSGPSPYFSKTTPAVIDLP